MTDPLRAAAQAHVDAECRCHREGTHDEQCELIVTENTLRAALAAEARPGLDVRAARHAIVQASINLANGDTVSAHGDIEQALAALAADTARPDAIDESRNATLDEVVRVVERLDGIVVLGGNAIANVHEPTREAVLDAVKALRG